MSEPVREERTVRLSGPARTTGTCWCGFQGTRGDATVRRHAGERAGSVTSRPVMRVRPGGVRSAVGRRGRMDQRRQTDPRRWSAGRIGGSGHAVREVSASATSWPMSRPGSPANLSHARLRACAVDGDADDGGRVVALPIRRSRVQAYCGITEDQGEYCVDRTIHSGGRPVGGVRRRLPPDCSRRRTGSGR